MALSSLHVFIVPLFLIWKSRAATPGSLNDEMRLLQTEKSSKGRKHHWDEHWDDQQGTNSKVHWDASTTGTEHSAKQGPLSMESSYEWFAREPPPDKVSAWDTDWQSRRVPTFTIDMDLPPEDRFTEVANYFAAEYFEFFQRFASHAGVHSGAKKLSALRGEETPELMGEIRGLAKATGIPEYWIHAQQLTAPLSTLKGPFLDIVDTMTEGFPVDPHGEPVDHNASTVEFLNHFTVPSFGNTGILATDSKDGTVWHARNLGFAKPHWMQKLTYNAVFKRMKSLEELYEAQMIFPLVHIFTGVRWGPNGYSFQLNTRNLDSKEGSELLIKNIYKEKRVPSGWMTRQVMEQNDNYDDAVKAFAATRYPNPEYQLISGVKKGTILAHDPDKVAYKLDLKSQRYLILVNSDYVEASSDAHENALHRTDSLLWKKSEGMKGISARERAQTILDNSTVITPMLLTNTLNGEGVITESVIFQTMINIEHGMYSTILKHCAQCDY